MIIWVDETLFEPGTSTDIDRLSLLRNAAQRRHTLLVSDSPDSAFSQRVSTKFDDWLAGLSPQLQDEVRALRDRLRIISANAVTRGARRLHVGRSLRHEGSDIWHVRLEDAIRIAGLPVNVLVENVINDAEFLRQAMPPNWRSRIAEWEQRGELRFEHGGGNTTMKGIVEGFAGKEQPQMQREEWRALHVVIYDHDGDSPNSPSDDAKNLQVALREAGLGKQSHMLERKYQEQYLPREAMEAILQKKLGDDRKNFERMTKLLSAHFQLEPRKRHFQRLPALGKNRRVFKNQFKLGPWPDQWYEQDGSWPEMRRIAELIASVM